VNGDSPARACFARLAGVPLKAAALGAALGVALLRVADCDGAGDSLPGVSSFLRLLSRGESMVPVVVVLKEWQLKSQSRSRYMFDRVVRWFEEVVKLL
jgi:hypothetical protein